MSVETVHKKNRLQPEINGKQIAITGGSGYLGGCLAKRLCSANHVRILDLRPPTFMDNNLTDIEFLECDITKPKDCLSSLEGVDIVFHRAGVFGNIPSMLEPIKYYNINLVGTLSILEACVAHKIDRLIFDSTEFVYGEQTELSIHEQLLPCPRSMYGSTKLAAEDLIRQYDRQFNISSLILRYCRIRDPIKEDVITFIARCIRDKHPIELYEGGVPSMDFVDIHDAEDAVIYATISEVRDTVINISSGTMLSLLEIVKTLAELMSCPLPVISSKEPNKFPPSVEYLFGPKQICLDISKAKHLLGWEPKKNMRKIIEETALLVLQEDPNGNNMGK